MRPPIPDINANDIRKIDKDKLEELLSGLSAEELDELAHQWEFWARPEQLEPEEVSNHAKDVWIINAGRGFGKTRAGAEWVRHRVKCGDKRIACVAPTKGDVRRVMVEGESGILNVCWEGDKTYRGAKMGKPQWFPTNNTVVWENGAKAEFFSAEDPERLRGPQFNAAWTDEVAAWRNAQDVWDMLQFTLRLGRNPKVIVTTTPKPTKLMRTLLKSDRAFITTGSTFDNADNLATPFLESVKKEYEGTRLGQQELYAIMLEEADGALWSTEILDAALIPDIEDPVAFSQTLARVVVAVDPAVSANQESDMTGIVVGGVDVNGIGYILEDATDRFTPQGWAAKVVELYHKYNADRIVAEKNQGGAMVRSTIEGEDESVPIRLVHASRGKFARAEPISALYERGLVKHLKNLDELETQMRTWEPLGSIGSPDRLDACLTEDTPVLCGSGYKPIKSVVIGEKVLTREGYKEVTWSGVTKKQALTLDIGLSNDYVVKATHEHPFYVQGKGWTRADDLEVGDQLVTEMEVHQCANTLSKLSSTVIYTEDTQTIQTNLNNDTTFAQQEKVIEPFTETCGNTTMALSQRVTTSITSMETSLTIPSKTYSVCPQSNMHKNTKKSFMSLVLNKWNTLVSSLQSGMGLKRVKSFTLGWVKSLGRTEDPTSNVVVQSAVVSSRPTTQASIVQKAVITSNTTKGTPKPQSVQSAEVAFSKTNINSNQKPALVSVVRVSESKERQDVYNLHVKDCHEFVASGVLVHNCVWALTDLMLRGKPQVSPRIMYQPKSNLAGMSIL